MNFIENSKNVLYLLQPMMEWEVTSSQKEKNLMQIKLLIHTFFHLKIKELPPYPRDIWVPTLLVDLNNYVKIFIHGLEQWFQAWDKLVRVEHVNETSMLLNQMLEVEIPYLYINIMVSLKGMDKHFWGKEFEDVLDWIKRLKLALEM